MYNIFVQRIGHTMAFAYINRYAIDVTPYLQSIQDILKQPKIFDTMVSPKYLQIVGVK